MSQIAKGVKYLHQYGIVHRDLKPENISITRRNGFDEIKVMDFGISKIVTPYDRMISKSGTYYYMAPEVILGKPHNKEIDIWSLGIILYSLLNGSFPFEGKNKEEYWGNVVYGTPTFYSTFQRSIYISSKAENLIKWCFEKSQEDRITIDQFINHLWFKEYNK